LGTDKILQFQIVQYSRERIDVLVVIDESLRDVGPSVDVICSEIEHRYRDVWGEGITITVKEVKEIKKEKNLQTPPRVVISKVQY